MKDTKQRAALILSANRVLLGRISAAMRAVFVTKNDTGLQVRFVIDGPITTIDREEAGCVASEMAADLPDVRSCREQVVRLDAPHPITAQDGSLLVFLRRE